MRAEGLENYCTDSSSLIGRIWTRWHRFPRPNSTNLFVNHLLSERRPKMPIRPLHDRIIVKRIDPLRQTPVSAETEF